MKNLLVVITVVASVFCGMAQNSPPTFSSVGTPSMANGYVPSDTFNLFVNFGENSNKRSMLLTITNQTNQDQIGLALHANPADSSNSNVIINNQNDTVYVRSKVTGSTGAWNFKWVAPSSGAETIAFRLTASAEEIGGTSNSVVYTCNHQVTSSSFGPVGACTNTSQVGIEDISGVAENFKIYPNPADESAVISYALMKNTEARIDILDLSGKLVQPVFNGSETSGDCNHQADVSALSPGMYIIRIEFDGKTAFDKIHVR